MNYNYDKLYATTKELFEALKIQHPDADYESDDEYEKCTQVRQDALEKAIE